MKTASPPQSVSPSVETFRSQLQFTAGVIRKNVGDVTHAESLRSFQPAGNGRHAVAKRCQLVAKCRHFLGRFMLRRLRLREPQPTLVASRCTHSQQGGQRK